MFSFDLDETGAVCNGREKENGWLVFVVVTSVIVDDARCVFRGPGSRKTLPRKVFWFENVTFLGRKQGKEGVTQSPPALGMVVAPFSLMKMLNAQTA